MGIKITTEGKIINTNTHNDLQNDLQKYWEQKLLETELGEHKQLFLEGKLKPLTKKEKVKQKIIDICERIIEWASK